MKINPIMQTKVFNQRKPQNSLNGFSNPLLKQQSVQDAFEKQISFGEKFKILLSEDEKDTLAYTRFLASCKYPKKFYSGSEDFMTELYNDLIGYISIGRDDAVHYLLYNLDLIGPVKDEKTGKPVFENRGMVGNSELFPHNKRENDYLREYDPARFKEAYNKGIEAVNSELRKLVILNIDKGTLQELKAKYSSDAEKIDAIAAECSTIVDGKYVLKPEAQETLAEIINDSKIKNAADEIDVYNLGKFADRFIGLSEISILCKNMLQKTIDSSQDTKSLCQSLYKDIIYLISAGYANVVKEYIAACEYLHKNECSFAVTVFPKKGKNYHETTMENILYGTVIDNTHMRYNMADYPGTGVWQAYDIAEKNFSEYLKTLANDEDVLVLSGYFPQFFDLMKEKYTEVVGSYIRNGNLSALKAKYPDEIYKINQIAAKFGIGEDGSYMTPKIEPPVYIPDFDSENAEINREAEVGREEAIESARRSTECEKGTGFVRAAKAVGTLGISEIIRYAYYSKEKKYELDWVNGEIAKKRRDLDFKYQYQIQKRREQMGKLTGVAQTRQKTEEVKEKAKQELQEGLINKINDFYKDLPVKMPNCVMLVTPNPYIARELAYWTGDVTDTNFVEIPYNSDKNVVQEDLINELEHAEEEYQNTGRRSIIYAENMEDLINPEINEDDKIAEMKYFMQCADRNYHSTVIFSTSDPKKLWFEAIQPHRVGLKVRIPITVDEANVYKKESEEQ